MLKDTQPYTAFLECGAEGDKVKDGAAENYPLNGEDLARISPLGYDHINLLGRYHFSTTSIPEGGLRPLRDPNSPE